MKSKNILFVCGIILGSAVVYGTYKLLRRSTASSSSESSSESAPSSVSVPACKFEDAFQEPHESEPNPEETFSEIKQNAAAAIMARHQAANELIKESINNIFSPLESSSSPSDDEEFNELNKQLDSMLNKGANV